MRGEDPGPQSGTLNELVVAAGALLDPAALARLATDQTLRVLGSDGALLSWWDDRQHVLVPLGYDDPHDSGPNPVFHSGQGLVGAVFERGVPMAVHDYAREVPRPMVWTDVKSGAAVPLIVDGRVHGVLAALHHEEREFGDDELRELEVIAAQVAPTLTTMKLLAAAQRRTAEAHALAALMRAGATARDHSGVVRLISEYASRLLGADVAGVVLREPPDGHTAWQGVYGNRTDAWRRRRYGKGHPANQAIFGGNTTLVVASDEQATIDPDAYPFFAAEGVQTGLALPLHCGADPLGSLVLGWRFRVQPAGAHVELAEALAGFAATLVDQANVADQRDALVANAPVALAAMNADGIVTVCEGAAADRIGLGPQVIGQHFAEVMADAPALLDMIRHAVDGGTMTASSRVRDRDFDLRFLPRGGGGFLVATDVTERVLLERQLAHAAEHDELTALPNTSLVISLSERALIDHPLAAVRADIRSFDAINETIGHDAADELLQTIGRRLVDDFPDAVVVGRVGGDEFAVVMDASELSIDRSRALAQRVRDSLEAPVQGDRQTHIEVRCGVAITENGEDARGLLRRADSALQHSRRGAGMIIVHDAAMSAARRDQLDLTADLRAALKSGALDVHFQPIVELATARLVRAEALARWAHPHRGSVPPDRFVDLAERSGLIGLLTEHVLDLAIARCACSLEIPVSVNVSGLDLAGDALPRRVEEALERHGVRAEMLSIEITESIRLEQEPEAIETLRRLRELGVKVAIDDFGTGWSSYTLLERLPATQLKLDRTYVQRMVTDPTSRAIVQSAVTLGQALGLQIVAEGIEDEATSEALHGIGCEIGQGFLFARPMPANELGDWPSQDGR